MLTADIVYLLLPLSEDEKYTVSPETLLKPYLDAILALGSSSPSAAEAEAIPTPRTPLFTLFYAQHPPVSLPPPVFASTSPPDGPDSSTSPSTVTSSSISVKDSTVLVTPPLPPSLAESSDLASQAAEAMFFKVVEVLRARHPAGLKYDEDEPEGEDKAEAVQVEGGGKVEKGGAGDVFEEIKAFWPPLENIGDDEGEEW